MVEINKEELAKLNHADRIKKLKEIEEDSKKQILEAEDLIKESEVAIEKESVEKKVRVPETKKVDISDLFGPPPEDLEGKTREAVVEETSTKQLQYMVNQAYEEAAGLAYQAPTDDVLSRVDALGEKLEKINYRSLTKDVANRLVATRSIIYKLKRYNEHDPTRW
ncbi:MAG: hypothetical protein ABIJ08_03505 [Nanoarchaeota archaeon]